MTNLEWLIKGSYVEAYDGFEGCKLIINGESGKLKELFSTDQFYVVAWLLKEHKDRIKLTQLEYDMIKYHGKLSKFNDIHILMSMKNKGHFKDMNNVEKCSMTIKEILENCEIVPDYYFKE